MNAPRVKRKPHRPQREAPLVLVADDHDDTRELYAQYLTVHGLRVIQARDGAEALRLTATRHPALILLDMGMPVMDGWDVARRLRADPRTRDIKILACTAYSFDEHIQRSRAAGCDDVLTKPCLPDQVGAAIRRLLRA